MTTKLTIKKSHNNEKAFFKKLITQNKYTLLCFQPNTARKEKEQSLQQYNI